MSPSNSSMLTSRIRDEARRLGFDGIGIARAGSLPYGERFDAWLKRGFHGEMHYLEQQSAKRRNPELVLADARSLIVLAWNYYAAGSVEDSPLKGRISRYAWGDDYHVAIKARLGKMLEFIRGQAPLLRGRCYVDTGPVMEKIWGAQTRLGWMGKNTNLISRRLGSWFFIGIILLDTELEYDSRHKDYCGTCARCLKSCPTGAIVAPYVLDSRLCISYLTIESRGYFPRSLRSLIGNRIYGCDECQEVCPWNRFAATSGNMKFRSREEISMPDLSSLVRLSTDEFNSRFKGSAIRRITRDGFVRNIVVALGNSGVAEAAAPLEEALQDESALVRTHAAWALGRLQTPHAQRVLESFHAREENASVLEEIALSLEENETLPHRE